MSPETLNFLHLPNMSSYSEYARLLVGTLENVSFECRCLLGEMSWRLQPTLKWFSKKIWIFLYIDGQKKQMHTNDSNCWNSVVILSQYHPSSISKCLKFSSTLEKVQALIHPRTEVIHRRKTWMKNKMKCNMKQDPGGSSLVTCDQGDQEGWADFCFLPGLAITRAFLLRACCVRSQESFLMSQLGFPAVGHGSSSAQDSGISKNV
jgi:hypothetical protein